MSFSSIEALESRVLLSNAELIANLNKGPAYQDLVPHQSVNGRLLVEVEHEGISKLWSYKDGVGVQILDGRYGRFSDQFEVIGSYAYFGLQNVTGESGWELWKTDGTSAGTTKLTLFDDLDVTTSTDFAEMEVAGNKLYVATEKHLWITDGTAPGTVKLLDGDAHDLSYSDGVLYFIAPYGSFDPEPQIYESKGTPASTVRSTFFWELGVTDFEAWNGDAIFIEEMYEVDIEEAPSTQWYFNVPMTYNAADAGANYYTNDNGTAIHNASDLHVGNDYAFFFAQKNDQSGIWVMDEHLHENWKLAVARPEPPVIYGTLGERLIYASGGKLLAASWTSNVSLGAFTGLRNFTIAGNFGYFNVDKELWRTDGTPAGTKRVTTLAAAPKALTPFETAITGMADGTVALYVGGKLWRSDGTAAGTKLVTGVGNGGDRPSEPKEIIGFRGAVYFTADDGVHGRELWRYDPGVGATMVLDLSTDNYDAPTNLCVANGKLFFTFGRKLYSSNGTAEGTSAITVVNVPEFGAWLVPYGGSVIFNGETVQNDSRLWKTDGTNRGTSLIADVSTYSEPVIFNNTLFFSGTLASFNSPEVWRSDGTMAGTVRHFDVQKGQEASWPGSFTASGGWLYFIADDGIHGNELWKTQLNPARTQLVADLNTTEHEGMEFGELADFNGTLYFTAQEEGFVPLWLYRTSGSASTTKIFRHFTATNLTSFNGRLYFAAENDGSQEVWSTDGTDAGTLTFNFAGDTFNANVPANFTPFGNLLYFSAYGKDRGVELWRTNGSLAGVDEINPSVYSSDPSSLTPMGDWLYFAADDGLHGTELWRIARRGSIYGFVFDDANVNGAREPSEKGVAGQTVFIDRDNDGALDSNEPRVITDSTGGYRFDDLLAKPYIVRVLWGSGGRATTKQVYTVPLAAGAAERRHFGRTTSAYLSGTVFNDVNANGILDIGEKGMSGWEVYVDWNDNGAVDFGESVFTDVSGKYVFRRLSAGSYDVGVVAQSGYSHTTPSTGARKITFAPGSVHANVNYGEKRIVSA